MFTWELGAIVTRYLYDGAKLTFAACQGCIDAQIEDAHSAADFQDTDYLTEHVEEAHRPR